MSEKKNREEGIEDEMKRRIERGRRKRKVKKEEQIYRLNIDLRNLVL
jgi:hypothetical protein